MGGGDLERLVQDDRLVRDHLDAVVAQSARHLRVESSLDCAGEKDAGGGSEERRHACVVCMHVCVRARAFGRVAERCT